MTENEHREGLSPEERLSIRRKLSDLYQDSSGEENWRMEDLPFSVLAEGQEKEPEEEESKEAPKPMAYSASDKRPEPRDNIRQGVFDRLLRLFYLYRVDWLLLVDQGMFYGVLDKTGVLKKLSEIRQNRSEIPQWIGKNEGRFPDIDETLQVFQRQEEFLAVDGAAELGERMSRPQVLQLLEKAWAAAEPISLLEVSQGNDSPSSPGPSPEKAQQSSGGGELDWFMSVVLESMPFSLAAVDGKGRLLFYNEHFKEFLAQAREGDLLALVEHFEHKAREVLEQEGKWLNSDNLEKRITLHFGPKKGQWRVVKLLLEKQLIGLLFMKSVGS